MFNVNTSVIAAECLKMFGVCDVAEAVAARKDRFIRPKRYESARYLLFVVKFSF